MRRFVVLYHEMPADADRASHWDFMLEASGALRTWALAQAPAVGELAAAVPLVDHRLEYLEYEGPVSEGRGAVTRWDRGSYAILEESARRLVVEVSGERLVGVVTLTF